MSEPLTVNELAELRVGDAITAAYVRSILSYDPDTGIFTWRERPREHFKNAQAYTTWNTRFSGRIAGSNRSDGYAIIAIGGRHLYAHRLAWLYCSGKWPKADVDHINGDRSDNRFENLREATRSQNNFNAGAQKNNTSGRKGVFWHAGAGKWMASIKVCNKQHYLGLFAKIEDAAAAYASAAKELHGEFARME